MLTGKVADQDGRGLMNFKVVVEKVRAFVATEGDFFTIVTLEPMELVGWVMAPDYAETRFVGRSTSEPTDHIVVLSKGWSLHGKVIASDGSPISGALVLLFYTAGRVGIRKAESDELGRFSFSRIGVGQGPFSVTVSAAGFKTQKFEFKPVHLAAAGEFVVILAKENPLSSIVFEGIELEDLDSVLLIARNDESRREVVNFDGSPVPAGAYILEIRLSGRALWRKSIDLKPGENRLPVKFSTEGQVAGAVFSSEGAVSGAAVDAYIVFDGETVLVDGIETAPDGSFVLRYLPAGQVAVTIRKQGFKVWQTRIHAESGQRVILRPMLEKE